MAQLDIDPASWARLSALLDEALEKSDAERLEWLEHLPADLAALKPQLRDLLSRDGVETADILRTLPPLRSMDLHMAETGGRAGERVGPYCLVRRIGEGGMGEVWLAERADGLMARPAAIKLPRIVGGRADIAERMAREREILGSLDHPHIARLYDTGVADNGEPYLALEYVEGRPLDAYCADTGQGRSADLRQRLQLLLQIAQAVAYAHGKLVVHRDLKPANVLVTPQGGVKLLDFGIAKLLRDGPAGDTPLTQFAGRALTLEYASPEQIRGEPLTIASDIYSLGVMLFELLTGVRPYRARRATQAALEEAILSSDPVRPSEIAPPRQRRSLRGDLDTIVMKALKKDPAERYPTVNALAEDLERFLSDRPVLARPDSTWYRMHKFVIRHAVPVSVSALMVFALLGATGVALWQARTAQAEQRRAEAVSALVEQIFEIERPNLKDGTPLTAVELLRTAAASVGQSAGEDPQVRAEIMRIIGKGLLNVADLDTADRMALDARRAALEAFPPQHPAVVRARLLHAEVLRYRGDLDPMRKELAALAAALQPVTARTAGLLWEVEYLRANLEIDAIRYDDATAAAKRARELAQRAFGADSAEYVRTLGTDSIVDVLAGRPVEALAKATDGLDRALALADGNLGNALVLDARGIRAQALGRNGRIAEAADEMEALIGEASRVKGPESRAVGFSLQQLVALQIRSGRIAASVDTAERALAILERVALPESFTVAAARNAVAKSLLAARRPVEAAAAFERVVPLAAQLFGATHRNTFEARASLAWARGLAGDLERAARELATVRAEMAAAEGVRNSRVLLASGSIERLRNRPASAAAFLQGAIGAGSTLSDEWERAVVAAELALVAEQTGDRDAETALRDAMTALDAVGHRDNPIRTDLLAALSRQRAQLGRLQEASQIATEVDEWWARFAPGSRDAAAASRWRAQLQSKRGV